MAGIKGIGEARTYDGSSLRIGIVHARWNTKIIDALLQGTIAELTNAGVKQENIVIQSVPGSYELPFAVQRMYVASQTQAASHISRGGAGSLISATADLLGGSTSDLTKLSKETPSGKKDGETKGSTAPFDAIIAIGALIKGSTMHFEYISDSVSHGLMKVQLDLGVPVIFGLLTLLTEEQGLERAGIAGATEKEGHNHGEDWGKAAVELAVMQGGWREGRFVE
ncbi:lumazine synthase [Recurvomyces mirabilis]|uniref:6,7-dimethyl-8-ribityllumazine synthase n=1 Tax=Recurvomyces mirabilis TaxID=574656 RepID=A0AAE0TM93_9PEZI|nr:lumazine synthase [Recurvomyces mirabilis]KAK5149801.1 lumazine synthase [Recurvomyces mirabilis]